MLTVDAIVELIRMGPTQMRKGKAMAYYKQAIRSQSGYSLAQRRFLQALIEQDALPPREMYVHPEQKATLKPPAPFGAAARDKLDPADLVWLQRLPADPAQVTFDDAVQLATLVRSVKAGTPDRRLLDSVWKPIKAVHDRRAAETLIRNATRPMPRDPDPYSALVDTIRDEIPALTEHEALVRASKIHRDAISAREGELQAKVEAAREMIASVDAEVAHRERLTA